MELNDHKDLFAQAYVRAIASVAGFITSTRELDRDSVDLEFSAPGAVPGISTPPQLAIQLKCTSKEASNGTLRFRLKLKNYNDLRVESLVPRILVVVMVPKPEGDEEEDPRSWLEENDEELIQRGSAYYRSLRGMPATGNETGETITIDRASRFCVDALSQMMTNISEGLFP